MGVLRYASKFDKLRFGIAILAALVGGAIIPYMVTAFGKLANSIVENAAAGRYCLDQNPALANMHQFQSPAQQKFRASAASKKFADTVTDFGWKAASLGCANFVIAYIFVTLLNIVAENVSHRMRHEYLTALLRQNIGWYDTVEDKNFNARVSSDLVKVQESLGEKVGLFIYFISTFLLSVGSSFYHGWKLTLVVLSSVPILAISGGTVAAVQSRLVEKEQNSYAKAGTVAEQALANIRTVKAFSGTEKELARYEEGLVVAKASAKNRGAITAFGIGLMWFIIYSSYGLAFWYGTKLILEGRDDICNNKIPDYTAEELLIVFFSILTGAFNLGQAASYIEAFTTGYKSAKGIIEVIDRVPEIDSYSEEGVKPTERAKGHIQFRNVSFSYPSRPDVEILKDFNLSILPGQTVAFVGHSGCGKSTLLQLLQRFYDATGGEVSIDDENVKNLHIGWLRSQIGTVSQEPVLFNTTILENIEYGREDVTLQEAKEASKLANAHTFISRLPRKYETVVGDRGTQLSGGQKQRIAIARALVRNPAILLLDEATSALDNQSESVVQTALDRARLGRTTLIVAHRLSTIRSADIIVAIESGKVAEMGTHDELFQLEGIYYNLVLAQMQPGDGDRDDQLRSQIPRMAARRSIQHAQLVIASLAESNRKSLESRVDEEILTFQATAKEPISDDDLLAKEAAITRLIKMNMQEWPEIATGIVMAAIQGCMMPTYAILFGDFLKILAEPDKNTAQTKANNQALLFLGLATTAGISVFLMMYFFSVAGEALTSRLRMMSFRAMLVQEMGWYDETENNIGALCSRLSGDASYVQGATGSRIGTIVQSAATIFLAIGLSLYYHPLLGVVAACFVPFVTMATFFQMKMMMGQSIGEKKAADNASKIAVQAIGNIRTVASLTKERYFVKIYDSFLLNSHKETLKAAHLRGIVFGSSISIPFFAYGTVMYYGGWLVEHDNLDFEKVFKVGESLIFGTMVVGQAMAFAPNYYKAKVSGARILRLLDRVPHIDASAGVGINVKDVAGTISFEEVGFSYPTRPTAKILRSLSFEVEPGKSIALVGPSGCGKSTCIQLILRFYDPLSGTIRLDQNDISDLNIDCLRSQMAIVAQEPCLFDRSIAENIAYGDNTKTVPMDEIISAAKQASIHNFIAKLPLGYETRVGDMGKQLSGGQKQRVAIARALVRRPKILLLDEATSALDTHSEKLVQQALDTASAGRTCITIAHRLSSIQNVDRILVINEGGLHESGTHAELLQKQGLYYQLWEMQGQYAPNASELTITESESE